ncbi:glycosyltransferase family 2 protein [Nonomuraea sp. NPDC050328]|uniref:glycosyltransferase family 2 protein n=1 Tax=Nonomuraea sp. NPDC050328 TaxID=3364361 RepID=UPI0037A4FA8F
MTATPPMGFVRTPEPALGRLGWDGDGWTADADHPRALRAVEVDWPAAPVPLDGLLELAADGVPLTAATAPAWVPPAFAEVLTDRTWLSCVPDGSPRCVADLRREEHSVRLRRAALPPPGEPEVSVVLSTMRPHLLGFALAQIARQRHVRVEIILGLHGVAFESVRQAVEECPLPVTWIEAGTDTAFGEVLNLLAARASGEYLAKWDDDDWYGPEHLADLVRAERHRGADVVGTTGEFFYLEPLRATIRRTRFASGANYPSEVWTDHVAGGTIFVSRTTFHDIGGFAALPRAVDKRFLDDARDAGARIYRTHGLGYMLRRAGGAEHTWQLPLAHFLRVQANQWRGLRPSALMELPHAH